MASHFYRKDAEHFMKISNQYKRVPCGDIKIDRENRQRKVIDTSDIDSSIRTRGVLQPIIVTRDLELIAGERRLSSSLKVGHADIPVRFVEDLSDLERRIIELEENIKRAALHWRDEVKAYGDIHTIYSTLEPVWDQHSTAVEIGVSDTTMSKFLRVYRDLNHPMLANAENVHSAWNMLARHDDRKASNIISDLIEIGDDIFKDKPEASPKPIDQPTAKSNGSGPSPSPTPIPRPRYPDSIILTDFTKWIDTYQGPRFNFIHCDFPYGLDLFAGEQSGKNRQNTYHDGEDTYWELIRVLCTSLDTIMSPSAHLMFWFSMDYYRETLEAFRKQAPSLSFQLHPLYWLKSDNVGVIPDAQRGPRRIVETAFIASREDRKIIRSKSNGYVAPTDKLYHTSTKPEPVLRHFFEMFVDEQTTMLDPTCGSGSSLRAAESLGARTVLGLERDLESHGKACDALRNFRILRDANKRTG